MIKSFTFLILCTLSTALGFVPCRIGLQSQAASSFFHRNAFENVFPSLPTVIRASVLDETELEEAVEIIPDNNKETINGDINDDFEEYDGIVEAMDDIELWEEDSKNVELVALIVWGASISAFVLYNNFVGPWPMPQMEEVPERFWRVTHVISAMLFGGGIILTTAIEWLVASNRNPPVLQFWFDKVPLLDAAFVLPALTVSIISGTGLCIENYGGLADSPIHIPLTFYALVAFASWWAATDLTTQGKTLVEVNEWVIATTNDNTLEVPKIIKYRRISNIVSCLFVVLLYSIMVLKPGVIYWKDLFQN